MRLRSISFSDPKLPRKVALAQGKFHEQRDSCNAYVVMETDEGAKNALALNGTDLDGHVIRVDAASNSKMKLDNARSVFVGNLHFGAMEDELRELFKACGEIETVRIVRDGASNMGKGFGFVLFKSPAAVRSALAFHEMKFRERPLRVTKVVDQEVLR